jgi:conjugative transfer signal peptidase TraF
MMATRCIPVIAAVSLLLIGGSVEVLRHDGWRVNFTESEPPGLYHLRPVARAPLPRGALVEFCPPTWVTPIAFPFYMSGACPGGGSAMLKTVAGIPGDRIVASEKGVTINGVTLPSSAPMFRSIQYPNIRLPYFRGEVVLGPKQYWVYGSGERPELAALSFDSRYFGPISAAEIRGSVSLARVRAYEIAPAERLDDNVAQLQKDSARRAQQPHYMIRGDDVAAHVMSSADRDDPGSEA